MFFPLDFLGELFALTLSHLSCQFLRQRQLHVCRLRLVGLVYVKVAIMKLREYVLQGIKTAGSRWLWIPKNW